MPVTREQVWQAADSLSKAGQKPTLAAVRELVGGSYSTLSPLLREWRERQAAGAPAGSDLPAAVIERAAAAGQAIWSVAVRQAEERLAGERAAMARQCRAAEAEKAEAVSLADTLAEQLEGTRAELAAARAELEAARRRQARAREDAARLSGALANQKEALAEMLAHLPLAPAKAPPDDDRPQ